LPRLLKHDFTRSQTNAGPIVNLVFPGDFLEDARERCTTRILDSRQKDTEDTTAAADEATAKLAHLAAAIEKITTEQ
jgi:hypothetical protein